MDNDSTGRAAFHTEEEGVARPAAETRLPHEDAGAPADMDMDMDGMEALLRDNDFAFRSLRRGETVEGTVVRIDPDEVLVDVGLKSEGVIPAKEFPGEGDDTPPLNVGDRTLVYVLQPEGADGHAILSLRRARMERSWRDIEDLYNRGSIIDAPVVDFNKGGLIVDVKGVRGFVPVSQVLDLRNVSRQEGENEEVTQTLQAMQGRRLPLKIIEINRSRNRLILSERAAVQEQRTQRKDELLDQLQPGQVRKGNVSNLTSFGAFVDLGGADGLVHVSELSYNRVNHPSEVLRVGQEVDVMVLSVDRDSKKIALSLKRAQPDPWSTVEQTYHVGQVVPATITKLAKFGAFAKVEEGLEGLIHLSELTELAVQDASQVVSEGQAVEVKIIHIAPQRRRLGLSVRQASSRAPVETGRYGDVDAYGAASATETESGFTAVHDYSQPESFDGMQSFGELENDSPFAQHDFGSLGTYDTTPEAATAPAENPESSTVVAPATQEETEPSAGLQDSPEAEHEPVADSAPADSPVTAAPAEASPALPEATTAGDEVEEPTVPETAPQGSRSE